MYVPSDSEESGGEEEPRLPPWMTEKDRSRIEAEVHEVVRRELLMPHTIEFRVRHNLRNAEIEHTEVDKAIRILTNTQVAEAHKAMDVLSSAMSRVDALKTGFKDMESMVSGMHHSRSYEFLRELHFARTNTNAVITWAERFRDFHVEYDEHVERIEANQELLVVYKAIKEVQGLRLLVRSAVKASRSSRGEFSVFKTNFDMVDDLSKQLSEAVLFVFSDAIKISLDDDEEHTRLLRECCEIVSQEYQDSVLMLCGDGGDTDYDGSPVSRNEIYEAMTEGIDIFWNENIVKGKGLIDIDAVLNAMLPVVDVCTAVQEAFIVLPLAFPIMPHFVQQITKKVVDQHRKFVDSGAFIAQQLITALGWLQKFKDKLNDEGLLDYIDTDGIEELCRLILSKAVDGLQDHMVQLTRNTAKTAASCDPVQNTAGYLVTHGPADVFDIVQQSIGSVLGLASKELIPQLARAVGHALHAYIDECNILHTWETWREREDERAMDKEREPKTDDALRDDRMYFLLALCNDTLKFESDMSSVEAKFSHSGESMDDVFEEFFDDLHTFCEVHLVEVAEHVDQVLATAWQDLFGPNWYDGANSTMKSIIETVSEFCRKDFEALLEETHVTFLLRYMMEKMAVTYVSQLCRYLQKKEHIIDKDGDAKFVRNFEKDMNMWHDFWKERAGKNLILKRSFTVTVGAIRALHELMSLQSADQFSSMVTQYVLPEFPDCPTFIIQSILDRRSQVDKSFRAECMEAWKERVEYQGRGGNDLPTKGVSLPKPSILGSVNRDIGVKVKTGWLSGKEVTKEEEIKKKKELEKAKQEKEKKKAPLKGKKGADPDGKDKKGKKPAKKADTTSNKDQMAGVEVTTLESLLAGS